jgi:hypothetical protein
MTTDSVQARVAAELRAAANKTLAEKRQETTTSQRPAAPERVCVFFNMNEAARISGVNRITLLYWVRRGWVIPASRTIGRQYRFSAWQLVGLALVAAIHRDVRKNDRCYIDRTTIRALGNLAKQDDALLLSPDVQDQQDMSIAERAAAIASTVIGGDGMSPEMMQNLTRALDAIDSRHSMEVSQRIQGEFP